MIMLTGSFTKDLYNKKVYGNQGNREVLNQVPAEAKSIMDVGCGAGDNAKILKELNKHVTGITISDDEAALVKNICDNVIVCNIESDEIKPGRKFDTIILSHVCEHLVHPGIAVNKLSRFLAENGIIIIAIPNMAFYKNRIRLLKGNWIMDESGPFDKTHLHFYSYRSADLLCDITHMKIIKKIPGSLALPLWPLRKLLPTLCKKADNSIGKYLPNLFAQQVILVLQPNNYCSADTDAT